MPLPLKYITDFVCTYHLFDCDCEDCGDDCDDCDMLYRAQFLQAFGIREYDNAAIDATLDEIAEKIKHDPEFYAVVMKHPLLGSSDTVAASCADILPFLFTYNSFHAFHNCLIELYANMLEQDNQDSLEPENEETPSRLRVSQDKLSELSKTYVLFHSS